MSLLQKSTLECSLELVWIFLYTMFESSEIFLLPFAFSEKGLHSPSTSSIPSLFDLIL